MKIIWIISIAFFVVLFTTCKEDTITPTEFGKISGQILIKVNDAPFEGAEVTTAPASSVVYSDSLGQFEMTDVVSGTYTISAKAENFNRAFTTITVNGNATTEVVLKLERSPVLPEPASNPNPEDKEDLLPLNVVMQWSSLTTSKDTVTFDVFLYESNKNEPKISEIGILDTFLLASNLQFGTTYFWQVNSKTSTGGESKGDLWSFSTQIFPDNRFAFVSRPGENFEIFTSNQTGENKVRITFTQSNNLNPRFNRDRSIMAISSNRDFNQHIYTMSPDGSDVFKVTNIPIAGFHSKGTSYSWASDFGQFIYAHYDNLYKIDRTGSNLTQIATAPSERNFRDMDWNAITNKIVAETIGVKPYDGEIYLMDFDGSNMTTLIDSLPGSLGFPSFSIDGKQVLYTYDVSEFQSDDGRQLDTHIFIIDIDTGISIDLSTGKDSGTNDLQPRFSPDGARVIFVNTLNDGSSPRAIYIMEVDGSNRQLVFENAENPEWR